MLTNRDVNKFVKLKLREVSFLWVWNISGIFYFSLLNMGPTLYMAFYTVNFEELERLLYVLYMAVSWIRVLPQTRESEMSGSDALVSLPGCTYSVYILCLSIFIIFTQVTVVLSPSPRWTLPHTHTRSSVGESQAIYHSVARPNGVCLDNVPFCP